MSKKVQILRRTPYGAPGDIVEVDDEIFDAYDRETMVETKEDLTEVVDHTLPADTVDRVDASETSTQEIPEEKAETQAETTSVDASETKNTAVESPKKKKLFGFV